MTHGRRTTCSDAGARTRGALILLEVFHAMRAGAEVTPTTIELAGSGHDVAWAREWYRRLESTWPDGPETSAKGSGGGRVLGELRRSLAEALRGLALARS